MDTVTDTDKTKEVPEDKNSNSKSQDNDSDSRKVNSNHQRNRDQRRKRPEKGEIGASSSHSSNASQSRGRPIRPTSHHANGELGAPSNHSPNSSRPRGRQVRSKYHAENSTDDRHRGRNNDPAARNNGMDGSRRHGPPDRSRSHGPHDRSRSRGPHDRSRSRSRGPHDDRPRGSSMDPAARNNDMDRSRSHGPHDRSRSRGPLDRSRSRGSHDRSRSRGPLDRSRSRGPHDDRRRGRSTDPATRNNGTDQGNETLKKQYPSQHPSRGRRRGRLSRGLSRRGLSRRGISVRGSEFTWCKLLQYVIPCAIIIGATVGLAFATGKGEMITDALTGLIPDFNNDDIEDPFSDAAPSWPSTGYGLRITMINALNDRWQSTFSIAVANWNNGDPDAVRISKEAGTYDKDCKAPEGKIIVCNGDYGETKWRGITESLSDYNGLISAEAKMNEFYLLNMGLGAWQYTMCHELGHSLGLAHTDEDFENEDLGDCMDYTDNLDANKQPTALNFNTLLELYGPLLPQRHRGLQRRQLQRDEYDSRVPVTPTTSTFGNIVSDHNQYVSVQRLRKHHYSGNSQRNHDDDATEESVAASNADSAASNSVRTVPDHIKKRKERAVQTLLKRIQNDEGDDQAIADGHFHKDGWKLLHRRLHGAEHEMELGKGYKVRVQLLLDHE